MTCLRAGLALLLALLTLTTGCRVLSAAAYYLRPPQIQKPAYEFPADSRVIFLVEAAQPGHENPVFNAALSERVVQMLRDGKSKATILPLRAVTDLRRANPDFNKWSLQKIGRKLQADHVLYVRVDRLVIRQTPEYPVLTPAVDLHVKLIGVSQPAVHARLWPDTKEGHAVSCARQTTDATDADAADAETRKLGYDTAYYVSMPFIKVDLEQKPPVEP